VSGRLFPARSARPVWRLFVSLLWLLAAAGCSREKKDARALPSGDAAWFRDGVASSEGSLEEDLTKAGFSAAYLPAVRLTLKGEKLAREPLPPPPSPLARLPVVLVITAEPSFETALRTVEGAAKEALAAAVSRSVSETLEDRASFGKVTGIHLDLPFSPSGIETFAQVVRATRKNLADGLWLTVSLRWSPSGETQEEEREALSAIEADGWVAFVFGEPQVASPSAMDALEKPWWAAYRPGARGTWKGPDGAEKDILSEKFLALLSDHPRVDFSHDITWKEETASAYLLRPRADAEVGGVSFAAGDVVSFTHPSFPEVLARLGADLSARKFARGRVVVLQEDSESERIFTVSGWGDVVLGRPLDPDLRVTTKEEGEGAISVAGENGTAHASVVSRTANWVEVDAESAGIEDVVLGGFDRYEVFDAEERRVSLGRATRVRFFETLIGPFEGIASARIVLRRAVPSNCCRWRMRVLSAAGTEVSTEWLAPEVPTPAAR